jgi:uncharacterized protein
MPYAVICIDRPGTRELRDKTRLAHMEYVKENRKRMVLGAALLDDGGETRVGMMIAVDLPTREAVEEFMRNEPYNAAGIFESVMIRKCVKIFPEEDPAHFDALLAEERRKAAARG